MGRVTELIDFYANGGRFKHRYAFIDVHDAGASVRPSIVSCAVNHQTKQFEGDFFPRELYEQVKTQSNNLKSVIN